MRLLPITEDMNDYAPSSKLITHTNNTTNTTKNTLKNNTTSSNTIDMSYFVWIVISSMVVAASYHEFYIPFWAPRLMELLNK